jgi:hypothetical protein
MGIEPPANSLENTTLSTAGGAKCGALATNSSPIDLDLAAIIRAWPDLPEAIRAAVRALVETARGSH